MMRAARWLPLLLLGAALGCTTTPVQTPIRSLDRPSDAALLCGAWLDEKMTLLPAAACAYTADAVTGLNGRRTRPRLFVLATNTERGELSLATTPSQGCSTSIASRCQDGSTLIGCCPSGTRCFTSNDINRCLNPATEPAIFSSSVDTAVARIVDLDVGTPGFGFLPVGKLPERLRLSGDGCRALTANVEGCDLSLVDTARLMALQASPDRAPATVAELVRSVEPRNGRGVPLRARPTWIEFAPQATTAGAVDGKATVASCDAGQGAYRALVAFPGCGLVAEINLDPNDAKFGRLTAALQLTRDGARWVDVDTVRCASECAGAAAGGSPAATPLDGALLSDGGIAPPPADGGVGSPATKAAYPHVFVTDYDGSAWQRLYIADGEGSAITVVDFTTPKDRPRFAPPTAPPRRIELDQPAVGGVNLLRLSPTIAATGARYLYAFGRDRTVRVVDVNAASPVQCETNPDPRVLEREPSFRIVDGSERVVNAPGAVMRAQDAAGRPFRCLPVGYPRHPLAVSPGISLPAGELPRDVVFISQPRPTAVTRVEDAPLANPLLMVGDYALLIASTGEAIVVNLADACPQPNSPKFNALAPPNDASVLRACNPDPVVFRESVAEVATNRRAAFNPRTLSDLRGAASAPLPTPIDLAPNRLRSSNIRFVPQINYSNVNGAARLSSVPQVVSGAGVVRDATDVVRASLCNVAVAQTVSADGSGVTSRDPFQVRTGCDPDPLQVQDGTWLRFHDPSTSRNEVWSVAWEGVVAGAVRVADRIAADVDPCPRGETCLLDGAAALCARGVETGDKVILAGCGDDTACAADERCLLDPARPTNQAGLCVPREPAEVAAAQITCQPWAQSLRRYRVREVGQSWLALGEIYEPEHRIDNAPRDVVTQRPLDRDCRDDADCGGVKVLSRQRDENGKVVELATRCLADHFGKRCLLACKRPADPSLKIALNGECGDGFVCASPELKAAEVDQAGQRIWRCMRAPLPSPDPVLRRRCFPGLQPYEVRGGDGFVVRASVSLPQAVWAVDPMSPNQRCMPSPERPPFTSLSRPRLPLLAPPCGGEVMQDWLAPLATGSANGCLLPAPAGGAAGASCSRREDCAGNACVQLDRTKPGTCRDVRFLRLETPVWSAVAQVVARFPEGLKEGEVASDAVQTRAPDEGTVIGFTVIGGFRYTSVNLGVQLPRVAIADASGNAVYIVDQGKQTSPSGLRGQVVRLVVNSLTVDRDFLVR